MYPYIVLFGRSIPTYGLCMATGILFACYIGYIYIHKQKSDVNSMIVISACAIGLGLFGSKLLYLFVSCDIEIVFEKLVHGDISDLTSGGQVFYGGLIGGIIGAILGAKISGVKQELFLYCDAIVPVVPLGHVFGRIGCFLAGCCYGAPYTGPFAVAFPKVGVMETVFPIQLLEAALNLCIFILLIFLRKKQHRKFSLLFQYLIMYSSVRFALEFLRGDEIRGIMHGISTSQWISLCLFILGHILIELSKNREKRSV